jgi:hypothetical protein
MFGSSSGRVAFRDIAAGLSRISVENSLSMMSLLSTAIAAPPLSGTGTSVSSDPAITGTGKGTPVTPPAGAKPNLKTVGVFTPQKLTPGDKALYAYLGQIGDIQRILQPKTPDEFCTELAAQVQDGQKIDYLIILGHGTEHPHIEMRGKEDLTIEHFDPVLIKERITHYSGEAEKTEKLYCEAETAGDRTAAARYRSALEKIMSTINRYRHNLRNLEKVRGIMSPGARILLLNCSAASSPAGEDFVKALGAALLTDGGVIQASKTEIKLGQVAGDQDTFKDGMEGFARWTVALLWHGEITNPGDYYVSPDGHLPRWLSNNWVRFSIPPQRDLRPYDHDVKCYDRIDCLKYQKPEIKPLGPIRPESGTLGFSGTAPGNWTGGKNDKGFHFKRSEVSGGGKPKDCIGEAKVNAEVYGVLNPSFAPGTIEAIKNKLDGEIADMKRYLSFVGGEVAPYVISGYQGYLLQSRPQLKGGTGSQLSGYTDLTVLAAGHGYVTKEGKTVEVTYVVTSGGCWNRLQQAFQEAEVAKAQAEAYAILAGLRLVEGGQFVQGELSVSSAITDSRPASPLEQSNGAFATKEKPGGGDAESLGSRLSGPGNLSPIVGRWTYQCGGFTDVHEYQSDGAVTAPNAPGARATWRLEGNEVVTIWFNNWTNRIKLPIINGQTTGVAISPTGTRVDFTFRRIE